MTRSVSGLADRSEGKFCFKQFLAFFEVNSGSIRQKKEQTTDRTDFYTVD